MRRETAGAVQACLLTAVDVSRHMATAPQRDEAAKQRNRAVGMRTEEEACAAPTGSGIWRQPYGGIEMQACGWKMHARHMATERKQNHQKQRHDNTHEG